MRRASRFDLLRLPMDPDVVAQVKPPSAYATPRPLTDEEIEANDYWSGLSHETRNMFRRHFADAIFTDNAPDLALLAYRAANGE